MSGFAPEFRPSSARADVCPQPVPQRRPPCTVLARSLASGPSTRQSRADRSSWRHPLRLPSDELLEILDVVADRLPAPAVLRTRSRGSDCHIACTDRPCARLRGVPLFGTSAQARSTIAGTSALDATPASRHTPASRGADRHSPRVLCVCSPFTVVHAPAPDCFPSGEPCSSPQVRLAAPLLAAGTPRERRRDRRLSAQSSRQRDRRRPRQTTRCAC